MAEFDRQVYHVVEQIPSGRVTTYGRIASVLDPPLTVDPPSFLRVRARWVGYALGRCPDDVPWHRVVNAGGGISPRPGFAVAMQRHLLEQEGVEFDLGGKVDLERYGWTPERRAKRQGGSGPPTTTGGQSP